MLGAIGFAPDQVDLWEPYQILAVYRGWKAANSPPKARTPTDEEFREAVARSMR